VYTDNEGHLYFNSLHFLLFKDRDLATMHSRSAKFYPILVFTYATVSLINLAVTATVFLNVIGATQFATARVLGFIQIELGISLCGFLLVTIGGRRTENIRHLKKLAGLSLLFYISLGSILLAALTAAVQIWLLNRANIISTAMMIVYATAFFAVLRIAYFNCTDQSIRRRFE
jgi:hypothetical protein